MSLYYILYHGLIFSALLLSFVAWMTGHKRFLPLCVMLALTFAVEIFAEIYTRQKKDFVWSYHIFIVFEYGLIAIFIVSSIRKGAMRSTILYSIPIFTGLSLAISLFLYHFKSLPAINIDLEGILLFVFCTYLLFNLETRGDLSIGLQPNLWIFTGVLIFFGGTFFCNGIYTNLLDLDREKALELFGIINKPLNIILYSCINVGLICLLIKRKYFMQ